MQVHIHNNAHTSSFKGVTVLTFEAICMKVRGHKHVVILLVYTRLGYSSTPKQELLDISRSKTFVYSTLVRLRFSCT